MEGNSGTTDPGELDNRLSLDPSDPLWKEFVGSWQDGQEYTMVVKARQISPGEFEVTGVTPSDSATEEEAEPAPGNEEAEPEVPEESGAYANPAVARMMKR